MGVCLSRFIYTGLLVLTMRSVLAQARTATVEQLYTQAHVATSKGDLPEAIRDYEQIIRLDPRLAEAYNNLGSLYIDTEQYQKAVTVLKRCLELRPHLGSASALLGISYLALGDPADASKSLSKSLAENPEDAHVEDLLEQALIATHDYQAAAARLELRISKTPNDQAALYRLGRVYLAMSQIDLTRARAVDPNSALAHVLEGEVQEAAGDLPRAQKEYEAAVRLDPGRPGTHEHLGNIFWLQGSWPAARTEFTEELKNDPASCGSRWKLANSFLQEKTNIPEALSELELAIQRCPDLMQARVDRAKALILLGRAPEAVPDLQVAEQKDPDESSIHFWLSKAYQAEGQNALASAEMQKFGLLVKQKPGETKPAGASGSSPP